MISYDKNIYKLIIDYNNTKDDKLFDIIYPELISLIKMVINNNIKNNRIRNPILTEYTSIKNDKEEYNDIVQDIMLHLLDKVLPKLYDNNGETIREYIYRSVNNKLINILKKRSKKMMNETELSDELIAEDNIIKRTNTKDIRIEIINTLDEMIKKQRIINKTNSIFLILLKDYMIKNDFDVREFNTYIQDKMNIKESTYNMIACRLGIRTKQLNEMFILNKYKDKKS